MKTYHPLFKLLFLLLAASLLAACSSVAETKHPPLRVEYSLWWGDYSILIAQEKGFFSKYGVEVEPVYYDVYTKALSDLASSQIDGGLLAIGDALNVTSHTSMTAVAVYDNGGVSKIIASPAIKSVADLKGQRIGVNLGTPYELMVIEMLKTANLVPSDVHLVNIDAEFVPNGLKTGDLQAGFTWEPFTSTALSQGNHILFTSDQVAGLFPDVITFRTEVVKQRPEDIKNFLKAWFEAVDYRVNNPDESNQIIARVLNIPVADVPGDAKILSLDQNYDIFSESPSGNFRSIYETAQENADFLIRIGSLTSTPDLRQLLDSSYLTK
jgi:NitT/TauT family transport system substrate-binding protein